MPDDPMKPEAIRTLLVHLLTEAAGGSEKRWAKCIGAVRMLPIATNIRCNWAVKATGTNAEKDAIRRAVEIVAGEHPYVSGA